MDFSTTLWKVANSIRLYRQDKYGLLHQRLMKISFHHGGILFQFSTIPGFAGLVSS